MKEIRPTSEFNLHIGEYVHSAIKKSEFTKTEIAEKLGVVKSALTNRVKKPHYGTAYDLMKISMVLQVNLFTPIVAALEKEDLHITEYFTKSEYEEVSQKLEECQGLVKSLRAEKESLYQLMNKLTK